MSLADGVGSHSHHRSSLCIFSFLVRFVYLLFDSGMKKLRQFLSPTYDSGGGGFHSLTSPAFVFWPFYPRWGYWLRVVVLSAWLSRMRSRVDRLMLSEIEAKTWKTNEMVVLDFFNPMFGGLMALMRYRYWSFESSPKMSLNLVGFRWNTVWFRQWRRDRDMMTCVFLAVED